MDAAKNILLVRVPGTLIANDREFRDYILESLPLGVLVLPDDVSCEVIELPSLIGGVEVAVPEAEVVFQETEKDEVESPVADVTGRNKEEKQAILKRLQLYRQTHGLGCWKEVAKEAGANITQELIRGIVLGEESSPIADWRRIDRAIQRLDPAVATGC